MKFHKIEAGHYEAVTQVRFYTSESMDTRLVRFTVIKGGIDYDYWTLRVQFVDRPVPYIVNTDVFSKADGIKWAEGYAARGFVWKENTWLRRNPVR